MIKQPPKILSPLQLVEYMVESTIAAGPQTRPFEYWSSDLSNLPDDAARTAACTGPVYTCPVVDLKPGCTCAWQARPFRVGAKRDETGRPVFNWAPMDPENVRGMLTDHLLEHHHLNGRIRNFDGWSRVHFACAAIQGLQCITTYSASKSDRASELWWKDGPLSWLRGDPDNMSAFGHAIADLGNEVRAAGFTYRVFPATDFRDAVYIDPHLFPWLRDLIASTRTLVEAQNIVRAVLAETARANRKQGAAPGPIPKRERGQA